MKGAGLHAHFFRLLRNQVGDAGGAFVVAGAGAHHPVFLFRLGLVRPARHQQGAGVRHHVVHGAHQRVPPGAQQFQDFHHRVGVVLAVDVGFQQVGEHDVRAVLPRRVAENRAGNGISPLALVDVGARAVTGEIVEAARLHQPAQFFGPHIAFHPVQAQGAYVAHVNPRPQYGQDMRFPQLGKGVLKRKVGISHKYSLTAPIRGCKGLMSLLGAFCRCANGLGNGPPPSFRRRPESRERQA